MIGGQQTSIEIFDKQVSIAIRNGEYVDAVKIMSGLVHIQPFAKSIPSYRTIQGINRSVDCGLDAFWHSNSIRIYQDLENFVTESISRQRKRKYERFEEIGVGTLRAHLKVVERFGFYSKPSLVAHIPSISTKSIIKYTQNFMSRNRGVKLDENSDIQQRYMEYLKGELSNEYNCDVAFLGVHVEYKDLFHKLVSIQGKETQMINEVKTNLINDYKAHLLESVKRFSVNNLIVEQSEGAMEVNERNNRISSTINFFESNHRINIMSYFREYELKFKGINDQSFLNLLLILHSELGPSYRSDLLGFEVHQPLRTDPSEFKRLFLLDIIQSQNRVGGAKQGTVIFQGDRVSKIQEIYNLLTTTMVILVIILSKWSPAPEPPASADTQGVWSNDHQGFCLPVAPLGYRPHDICTLPPLPQL